MPYAVFLDTMTYLHYRPVDQVDWHAVLQVPKTEEVVLVVPGITLREIDKHKNHTPRLRERAQRVGAQLAAWVTQGRVELRPQVYVEGALGAPAINLASEGLDATVNDDVLVGAVLDHQRRHPEATPVLVTQDSYPAARASGFGLTVRRLPDDLKLPAEEDELERENRELRRDLQRLQAARPHLTLAFAGGAGLLEVSVRTVAPRPDEEITAAMEAARRKFPPAETYRDPPPRPARPAAEGSGLPPGLAEKLRQVENASALSMAADEMRRQLLAPEIDRYKAERERYLTFYERYLREKREHDRQAVRRFALRLVLLNRGSVPAADVDVEYHIPDGLGVDEDDEFAPPHAPEPPVPPRPGGPGFYAGLGPRMPLISHSFDSLRLSDIAGRHLGAQRNVSGLDIEETGSYTVRCHARTVKHGREEPLPTLYATLLPDAPIRPFQITYTLHAANIPEAVRGVLNVRLLAAS